MLPFFQFYPLLNPITPPPRAHLKKASFLPILETFYTKHLTNLCQSVEYSVKGDVIMDHMKPALAGKKIASIGILIGLVIFFGSLFASGYNENYYISVFGIGVIIASMVFFGFGMFLSLADEISSKRERI